MSEPTPSVAQPDALGVVDPLRIPGLARGRRLWAGLPRFSQVFVALVAVDIVVRALGLFDTSLFLSLAAPLSVITAFLPHDALILLPAVIVWRRPDALDATPQVVAGAMAVALVELLNAPLRGLLSGNERDLFTPPTVIAILAAVITAIAWIVLAEGLRQLNPPRPKATAAGLANLVGGAIAVGALIQLLWALLQAAPDLGDPTWSAFARLSNAVLALGLFALAYLGRTVVLGMGDDRRPAEATNTATGALTLFAIASLLTTLWSIAALWMESMANVANAVFTGLYLLSGPIAMTALVVAFGLGLADRSGTIEPVTPETAAATGTP